MKFLGNTALFAIIYLVFMIPTYLLPWVGSNSTAINTVGASADYFSPMLIAHASCLLILVVFTWFRGSLIDKKWLVIFPILATIFDLIPGLSLIPLVPTVMHLLAIILGVVGVAATTPSSASEGSTA